MPLHWNIFPRGSLHTIHLQMPVAQVHTQNTLWTLGHKTCILQGSPCTQHLALDCSHSLHILGKKSCLQKSLMMSGPLKKQVMQKKGLLSDLS
jgi:hypothetical protein